MKATVSSVTMLCAMSSPRWRSLKLVTVAEREYAMPKVIADITMSLDGFVTGPGADDQHGLGDAPEIHTWVMEQDAVDTEILEGATAASGAVVMGRRLFDIVNSPDGWNKDMGYGADQNGDAAVLRRHPLPAARRPPGA